MDAESVFRGMHNTSKLAPRSDTIASAEDAQALVIDDQGAYGIIRAVRERALMVELRKKDGEIMAIHTR